MAEELLKPRSTGNLSLVHYCVTVRNLIRQKRMQRAAMPPCSFSTSAAMQFGCKERPSLVLKTGTHIEVGHVVLQLLDIIDADTLHLRRHRLLHVLHHRHLVRRVLQRTKKGLIGRRKPELLGRACHAILSELLRPQFMQNSLNQHTVNDSDSHLLRHVKGAFQFSLLRTHPLQCSTRSYMQALQCARISCAIEGALHRKNCCAPRMRNAFACMSIRDTPASAAP